MLLTLSPKLNSFSIILGTFVKFDPKNDPKGPLLDGFAGGLFSDSSTAYVAFGNGASCSNQFQAPCSLSSSSSSCKIPCGAIEIVDSTSAFYLQKNPSLTWVSTTSANVINVPNALKLLGPNNLMFGRAFINGVYVFGKIQAGNGVFSYQAVTSSGAVQLTNNFDVLTCYITQCGKLKIEINIKFKLTLEIF